MALDSTAPSRPAIGPLDLGVRIPPDVPDVTPVPLPDGIVGAKPKEGMSVFDDPHELPLKLRPSELGGNCEKSVWEFDLTRLPRGLEFRLTRGAHGVIRPETPVALASYEKALASTVNDWSFYA